MRGDGPRWLCLRQCGTDDRVDVDGPGQSTPGGTGIRKNEYFEMHVDGLTPQLGK